MLRYKLRDKTTAILVVPKALPVGCTADSLRKQARRAGRVDTGYHVLLWLDGTHNNDRPIEAQATSDYPEAIMVLAAVDAKGELSNCQRHWLNTFAGIRQVDWEVIKDDE